jgi:hypothetical protein
MGFDRFGAGAGIEFPKIELHAFGLFGLQGQICLLDANVLLKPRSN